MKHHPKLLGPVMAALLAGCDPGQPGGTVDYVASGRAAALGQAEFNQLEPEQQYAVASKLYGTLFRGVPVDRFFDLSGSDTTQLEPSNNNFLNDVRNSLRTDMNLQLRLAIDAVIDGIDNQGNPDPDAAKYLFDRERPRQIPLARIKEYPVSRDLFVVWMAYFLTNTIMFSPAIEMESTTIIDAQRVYRFLVDRIGAGESVRAIVRANLPQLHRWRISRSPENHALEAYELYLGLFETEEDSYRGGIACKDYYLTDEANDYLIDVTDFPNTTPQLILDSYYVTSCEDLYDVIAGHPLLLPRVTEVIINYLMAGSSLDTRLAMIDSIVAGNPETFEDIFSAILFSREYLLMSERPRSFEENFMPMLDTLRWNPSVGGSAANWHVFRNMTSRDSNQLYMGGMGWDVMSLKIGRLPDVPLDGLSFANYHKAVREELLLKTNIYSGRDTNPIGLIYNGAGDVLPVIRAMSMESFIDYLFLGALQRKPDSVEQADLVAIIVDDKNYTDRSGGREVIRDDRFDDIAGIVFDYISRLPEFYYFRSVLPGQGVNP